MADFSIMSLFYTGNEKQYFETIQSGFKTVYEKNIRTFQNDFPVTKRTYMSITVHVIKPQNSLAQDVVVMTPL